jgi:hypothetical protein
MLTFLEISVSTFAVLALRFASPDLLWLYGGRRLVITRHEMRTFTALGEHL